MMKKNFENTQNVDNTIQNGKRWGGKNSLVEMISLRKLSLWEPLQFRDDDKSYYIHCRAIVYRIDIVEYVCWAWVARGLEFKKQRTTAVAVAAGNAHQTY